MSKPPVPPRSDAYARSVPSGESAGSVLRPDVDVSLIRSGAPATRTDEENRGEASRPATTSRAAAAALTIHQMESRSRLVFAAGTGSDIAGDANGRVAVSRGGDADCSQSTSPMNR